MKLSTRAISFAEACRDGDIIEGTPVQMHRLACNAQVLVSEIDKLHDALESYSELIKALRNEIATKDKRIGDLEFQYDAVRQLCNEHAQRIGDLEQTVLYLTAQCQECVIAQGVSRP